MVLSGLVFMIKIPIYGVYAHPWYKMFQGCAFWVKGVYLLAEIMGEQNIVVMTNVCG